MIGIQHIHLESVDSTNRYARDLLRERPPEGTIVTADAQTAGRGRLDRQWHADAARNVLLSVVLYPARAAEEWGGLPLLAGLAVHRAIGRIADIAAHVKWPNDVLVGDKKVCGILVESGGIGDRPWAIVGIGINVNQERFDGEYRMMPTSLLRECGTPFDLDAVVTALCEELDMLYTSWSREGNDAVIASWKRASRMIGARVRVDDGGRSRRGMAVDLAPDGALIVEWDDGGSDPVYAGDVTVREEEA